MTRLEGLTQEWTVCGLLGRRALLRRGPVARGASVEEAVFDLDTGDKVGK